MDEIRVEREVQAPAGRVWEVMTDVDGSAEVISGIDAVERLDGGDGFDVGLRWRETRTMMGKQATEEMTVTEVDPGRSYVVEADSRGTHYRSVMAVEPTGPATSRLTMTFAGQSQGGDGKLKSLLGRVFAGATRKALAKDLADIAAAAEARFR